MYSGGWKNGLPDGKGSEIQKDQDVKYEGAWKDGQKHGYGKYVSKGEVYEGQWEHDEMHGKGCYSWTDGRQYIGDYVNNQK